MANGKSAIPEKASTQVEMLQRLAAELALVAEATKAGTLGYVIGRSHAKCVILQSSAARHSVATSLCHEQSLYHWYYCFGKFFSGFGAVGR